MHKKNLFITFPVDAGMKASEETYKKIFSNSFNFNSFSYKNKNNKNIYNENIRKKRYRFLVSFKLRAIIKKYVKKNELIIFHSLSAAIYTFGSFDFKRVILTIDAPRELRNHFFNKTIKKNFIFYIQRYFYRKIPKILCWSYPAMDVFNKVYGVSKKQLFKVPGPIDAKKFNIFPRKTPLKPSVIFIGREFVRKGGDIILKNLHRFINNCNLTMVTEDKKADIDNVKYFDAKLNKDQILDLYNSNDILILPSQFDPYGLVLAEAASAGLAVITTKFALGSKDIVINNKTGFIAETQEECINKLVELIKDPKKIDDFKIAAYKKMELEFSESKIYNEYVKIINN